VLRVFGVLRACWPIGLVFIQPGVAGLVVVMATELGLILCISIFNPVFVAYRLRNTDDSRQARVLTAWSIGTSVSIAVVTVVWGLLAQVTSPRIAIALAGIVLLGTPFLLPRGITAPQPVEAVAR
jgi:predicted RND superfamily exporter protein